MRFWRLIGIWLYSPRKTSLVRSSCHTKKNLHFDPLLHLIWGRVAGRESKVLGHQADSLLTPAWNERRRLQPHAKQPSQIDILARSTKNALNPSSREPDLGPFNSEKAPPQKKPSWALLALLKCYLSSRCAILLSSCSFHKTWQGFLALRNHQTPASACSSILAISLLNSQLLQPTARWFEREDRNIGTRIICGGW